MRIKLKPENFICYKDLTVRPRRYYLAFAAHPEKDARTKIYIAQVSMDSYEWGMTAIKDGTVTQLVELSAYIHKHGQPRYSPFAPFARIHSENGIEVTII